MILPRAAFASGVVFAIAIWASLKTRDKHQTLSQWWNSDGSAIWMIAVMIGGGLLLAR